MVITGPDGSPPALFITRIIQGHKSTRMAAAKTNPRNEKPRRSLLWRLFKWTFALAFLIAVTPLAVMLFFGLWAKPEKADAIVVPGAALWTGGTRLSDALEWRMDTAIELYKQGYAPFMILSGGGEGAWNEPEAMARYAMEHGVPAHAIILDNGGESTRATGESVARIMKQRGMDSALVTSQWYHVPRTRWCLSRAGVTAHGVECSHPNWLRKEPYFVAREAVALYATFLNLDT